MFFPRGAARKASGIYAITCLANGKCYVGSAIKLRQRFDQHISQLRDGTHHGVRMQRAWKKYGADAFLYEVLEYVADPAVLIEREQLHIDLLGAYGPWGYNSTPRAGSMAGFSHSAETRARMSTVHKAKGLNEALQAAARLVWTGRKHTDEALANMRKAKAGKPVAQAALDAARAANLGHHRRHSAETRAKMAAKAIGRVNTESQRAAASKAHKGVKWTPERTAKRIATLQANQALATEPVKRAGWTPERTAKFIATFAAKRAARGA